jgi:hypothetical protein
MSAARMAGAIITVLACGGCVDQISCDEIHHEAVLRTSNNQVCTTSGDCRIVTTGCGLPGQCGEVVNAENGVELTSLAEEWEMQHCTGICIPCPPPEQGPLVCREGFCFAGP